LVREAQGRKGCFRGGLNLYPILLACGMGRTIPASSLYVHLLSVLFQETNKEENFTVQWEKKHR